MASPDPTITIQDGAGAAQATTNGVNVTPGNVVTVALLNSAGVNSWTLTVASMDDVTAAPALTINTLAKTATFTGPAAGAAIRLQSAVIGATAPGNSTTACAYTLTAGGKRVLALNETTEGSAASGWIVPINAQIRAGGGGGTVTWANDLAGSTGTTQTVVSLTSAAVIPVTTALSFGASPSLTGALRLASTKAIASRNNAGLADLNVASYNSSDQFLLGDPAAATVFLSSGGGMALRGVNLIIQPVSGAINAWSFSGLASGATSLTVDASLLTPTITQAIQANASNPNNFTIAPQAPGAGAATTTTGTPGSFIIPLAAPVSTGARAFVQFTDATNNVAKFFGGGGAGFLYLGTGGSVNYTIFNDTLTTGIWANSQISLRVGTNAEIVGVSTTQLTTSAGVSLSVNGAGSYGGGVGVFCLKAATTNPSSSPTGGYVQYALNASGLPAVYGPAALVVTTVGAAGTAAGMPVPAAYKLETVNGIAYRIALFN